MVIEHQTDFSKQAGREEEQKSATQITGDISVYTMIIQYYHGNWWTVTTGNRGNW